MKRTTLALAFTFSFAPASAALAEGKSVHDGKWEITTNTQMPGMPFQPPPRTHTQCLTKKEAVPQHAPHGPQDCKVSDVTMEGGHVTWKVKCSGAHPAEGKGEVNYHGDTFDGTMTMTAENPRTHKPMEMTHTMHGKRVGECEEK